MNPVLIYADNQSISNKIAILNAYVPYVQSVYDAYKAIGIEVQLQIIANQSQYAAKNANVAEVVTPFVTDKLTDLAGPVVFNNVAIKREAVKNMIVVPNLTLVNNALLQVRQMSFGGGEYTPIDYRYLQVVDGMVSKTADSDAKITAYYSVYTKTDTGAQLATKVIAVCDALNSFYADMIAADGQIYQFGHDNDFLFPSIKVMNNHTFVPNPYWFQKFNQL